MEESKIKKIILLITLICSLTIYGEEFKYDSFDYMFQMKNQKELKDGIGELYIENSISATDLIVKYNNENMTVQFKLKEKVRQKTVDILQKYLAWSNAAENKGMKMDKYIDKIDNIRISIEKNLRKSELTRELRMNLFYYDIGIYYLSIEFTEVQGKKAEKIYLNREQVIELINKINEDAIKDGIKLHEMNQEI